MYEEIISVYDKMFRIESDQVLTLEQKLSVIDQIKEGIYHETDLHPPPTIMNLTPYENLPDKMKKFLI